MRPVIKLPALPILVVAALLAALPAQASYVGDDPLPAAKGGTGVTTGLSQLNGTNVTSGTVADARLSSNVFLLNAASNSPSGNLALDGFTSRKYLSFRLSFAPSASGGAGLAADDTNLDGNWDGLGVYGHDGIGLYAAQARQVKVTSTAVTVTPDLVVATAGKGLQIKEGLNSKMGVASLVAGAATISTTAVTANSRIFTACQADGGTPGWLRVSSRTAGTSFTITSSSGTDTSTVAWVLIEPAP